MAENNNKLLSVEEEEAKIAIKLDERVRNTVLIDKNTGGFEENRIVINSLCTDSFEFFCNNFAWIQNPQADNPDEKNVPFILYEYQVTAANEIIKAITNGYDLPIEKSRKMGLSWLLVVIIVWGWHFHRWDCLLGSQTADKVDKKGDIGSLMEKCRYTVERLPQWMLPALKDKSEDKYKLLLHPLHQARISGESNTVKFGRSDRHKVILFDEFSSWECTDRSAWTACGQTANCRIPLSTPNQRGVNCYFYKIVSEAQKKQRPILTLHWTLNPVFAKDCYFDDSGKIRSPWYDRECERAISPMEIAQELDINYEASMSGKVFSEFNIDQVRDDIEYNPDLPLYVGWDWGLDGTALIWFQPDSDGTIYIIDEYQNTGKGAGADIIHYIDVIESKQYKAAIHFGDPYSGENRQLAARGNSNAGIMRKFGLVVKTERCKIAQRIAAGRNLLSKIVISSNCPLTIEMFISWSLEEKTAVPKHDEYSHNGDAYTYFCFNYKNRAERRQIAIKRREYTPTVGGSVM